MKHLERIGTSKEHFIVSIRFLTCELMLTEESLLSIVFIRGPQAEESSKKKV